MKSVLAATAAVFALAVSSAGYASDGPVGDMAGRVLDPAPQGPPLIRRSDGTVVKAVKPVVLFGGDHILLRPGQQLTVRLEGRRQTLSADRLPIDYLVPDPARGASQAGNTILETVRDFLYRPPLQVVTPTYARGPDGQSAPPAPDPILPIGRQLLTHNVEAVVLIWRNPANSIEVTSSGPTGRTYEAYGNPWVVISAPAGGTPFAISAPNSNLAWQVDYSDDVPSPPGLSNTGGPASPGDRLARAIWLLREGPAEWRLFAFSEIYALKEGGDFVAGEVWAAAQTGQLDHVLTTQ